MLVAAGAAQRKVHGAVGETLRFEGAKKSESKKQVVLVQESAKAAEDEILLTAIPVADLDVKEKDASEEKAPGFLSRAFATVRGFFYMTLAMIGGGHAYDAMIGDGPLPRMNMIQQTAPQVAARIHANNTAHLFLNSEATPEQLWQGLKPTLDILDAVSPDIANWVRDRNQQGKLLYSMPGQAPEGAIAGYQPMSRELYLSEQFWLMSNGEKAATLAHEFRHSRQNLPKAVAVRMTQLVTGELLQYPSKIEDEAFMYQAEFYRALGLKPSDIRFYLDDRDLYHLKD